MATKRNAIQRREELIDQTEHMTQHQPKIGPSNSLKIKLDHLHTFSPLTPNQEKFFEMYRGGAYCIGLFGSPGVGKCQGEDVEVNLMVSEEMYDKLMSM